MSGNGKPKAPALTQQQAWKAFWDAQGRWLEHRFLVHKDEGGLGPCDHKEQKEVNDAADAYMAAPR